MSPALAPLFAASVYWHLPLLVVLISLVYSATRFDDWWMILRESVRWGRNLIVFLVGLGVVLFVVSLFV